MYIYIYVVNCFATATLC